MEMQRIKKWIRLAGGETGIHREIFLLMAFNEMFDRHVSTEADWRAANPEIRHAWRRQVEKLLESLEFAVASADAYSDESDGLMDHLRSVQDSVSEIEARRQEMDRNIQQYRDELEINRESLADLEKELALLKTAKELASLRRAIRESGDEQKVRSLANGNLAETMNRHKIRLTELHDRIQSGLIEQERLLKEEILENEQWWDNIRKKLE